MPGGVGVGIPYSTRDFRNRPAADLGGNYFRQIPYTLMRHAVRSWHKRHDGRSFSTFTSGNSTPNNRASRRFELHRIRHYRKLDKMMDPKENLDCIIASASHNISGNRRVQR